MADVRTQEEGEPLSSDALQKEAEKEASPTAAEQKDVDEVIADGYRDDRFQASDN